MDDAIVIDRIGSVTVWQIGTAVYFRAGMAIDVDGAPNAYHPPTDDHPESGRPPGFDDLRNAGYPGNWWGIATDDAGEPIVQGADQPFPGWYVSTTALSSGAASDPRSYVDATTVPFFVLPSGFGHDVSLGDLGMVLSGAYHQSGAIYADVGPSDAIGEGSVALSIALGLFQAVTIGHDAHTIDYLVFPGSRGSPPWPRPLEAIRYGAEALFAHWGGRDRLRAFKASLATP